MQTLPPSALASRNVVDKSFEKDMRGTWVYTHPLCASLETVFFVLCRQFPVLSQDVELGRMRIEDMVCSLLSLVYSAEADKAGKCLAGNASP